MARKGTGRQQRGHLADMSLPADQRGRPRRPTARKRRGTPAQYDHGSSPDGRRKRREGERKMWQDRDRRASVLDR